MTATAGAIHRGRLAELLAAERRSYTERHPRSAEAHREAVTLLGQVPMTWMNKNAGGFPLYLAGATGARVSDLDGHSYVDFSLGDSGAMAGHSPAATVAAVHRRLAETGGATAMMPTEDATWVGGELASRFGVARWSFSLTATDANRWAIRLVRAVTGRPKILVHSYCYHGSVDETLALPGPHGRAVPREGNVGAPCDVALTTRVAEYNDLEALERELGHGDVAAVLMEPALTNIGIVLPQPGYLAGVRALTVAAGTLLINDETHTISAGPGGCTAAWGLSPDVVTVGKAIGGGIPAAAYGLSAELAGRLTSLSEADLIDTGGIGGTLSGNALSLAAVRATLGEVLTEEAFDSMIARCDRYRAGVQRVIDTHQLPWSISQVGARAEYRFASPAPVSGTAAHAGGDDELEDYLHVFLLNRGVLLTPFHNMALMCPVTTDGDVDLHLALLEEAVRTLLGG